MPISLLNSNQIFVPFKFLFNSNFSIKWSILFVFKFIRKSSPENFDLLDLSIFWLFRHFVFRRFVFQHFVFFQFSMFCLSMFCLSTFCLSTFWGGTKSSVSKFVCSIAKYFYYLNWTIFIKHCRLHFRSGNVIFEIRTI
jgi:hypothetical protein